MDINKISNDFVTAITHPKAGEAQRNNTKENWIAGFCLCFELLSAKISELPEDDAMNVMTDLHKQLEILKEKIIKGELKYVIRSRTKHCCS